MSIKRWLVRVSVPTDNGHYQVEEVEIEGDEEDCEAEAWNLLLGMGVETSWEEINNEEE